MGAPRLRYFDCRSRGQALRFALEDADLGFEDLRIPCAERASFRRDAGDPAVGGPFAQLPLLEWDGATLAQTLAIAGYLEDRLRPEATAEQRAHRAMIASAAHLDMQALFSEVLWLDEDVSERKLATTARGLLDYLERKAGQLEALLGDGPWFGGAEPAVCDFFVFESLSRARDVFDAAWTQRLGRHERLVDFERRLGDRPRIEAYLGRGRVPFAVTCSPSEKRLRERLLAEL